jgi:hypothetical protein
MNSYFLQQKKGMTREVANLIRENSELLQTK